jgi:hypothetical protein
MVYNLRAASALSIAREVHNARSRNQASENHRSPRYPGDGSIEFPCETPYAGVADEFVRLSCRDCAGWRRDEWAYSPLFIWCKFLPEYGR